MATGIFTVLNVADLERSRRFYAGLGLRAIVGSAPAGPEHTMRWVSVMSGPAHRIVLFDRAVPGASPEDVAWASGDVGKGVLVNIGVPNAQRTHAKALAAKLAPEELMPNPWGGHAFNVQDPDGYFIHVTDRFPQAPRAATKSKRAAAKKTAAKKATKKGAKKNAKRRG